MGRRPSLSAGVLFGAILRVQGDEISTVHIDHDLMIMFDQLGPGPSGQQ